MNKKNFGVLIRGAGWVSTQHLAAFHENPATRVVAVSSRSLVGARKRASEAGLKEADGYDNFAEALRRPDVDIVCVCTPPHIHSIPL
jgi:UDP-N-acetyl-2-amino-2-deoxyglucuronate dehydrogenase